MTERPPLNDNRHLEDGFHDRDRHYVRDYLKQAIAHFEECNINRETVFNVLADSMMRLLPANPYRNPPDESALLKDLMCLWPLYERVEFNVEQYEKALDRAARLRSQSSAEE